MSNNWDNSWLQLQIMLIYEQIISDNVLDDWKTNLLCIKRRLEAVFLHLRSKCPFCDTSAG